MPVHLEIGCQRQILKCDRCCQQPPWYYETAYVFRLENEVQIYLGKVRNTEISLAKPSGNLGVRLCPGYKLSARV